MLYLSMELTMHSNTFGSGSDLGGGNFVVYDGAGGPYSYIYGLDHSTTYYIKVFEYNGSDSETYYLTANDSDANPISDLSVTTLTYPSVQASNITFSNITGTSMTLNWTNGDGTGRILIARAGSPVDIEPQSLISYSAISNLG